LSLRDQLLAKGLVSKKDVRRVDQELRDERKHAQAHKQRASKIAAEEAENKRVADEAAARKRAEDRKAREAAREAAELRLRIKQIIARNAVRSRGKVRFHHKTIDGRHVSRIEISDAVAWKLRCGEAAIVAVIDEPLRDGEPAPEPTYVVVSARAAERLEEFASDRIVHWVRDSSGLSAKEEAFLVPEWEISLKPHRSR
jgi:hypothetical protein